MKQKLKACIGCDLSAYAHVDIGSYDLPLTEESQREILAECLAQVEGEKLAFDLDWSTRENHRLVELLAQDGETLLEDVPLEKSAQDVGLIFGDALLHSATYEQFVNRMAQASPWLQMEPLEVRRILNQLWEKRQ